MWAEIGMKIAMYVFDNGHRPYGWCGLKSSPGGGGAGLLPVTAHTGGVGRNTSDLSIVITSMGHYPHGPKGLLALPAVCLSVKARSDMGGAGVLELPAAADGRWCKLLRIAVNVMGGLSAGNKSFGRCGAAAHRGGGQRFFDSAERTGVVLDSVWGLITGNCGWGTCAVQGGLCARADAVNWLFQVLLEQAFGGRGRRFMYGPTLAPGSRQRRRGHSGQRAADSAGGFAAGAGLGAQFGAAERQRPSVLRTRLTNCCAGR